MGLRPPTKLPRRDNSLLHRVASTDFKDAATQTQSSEATNRR